jgi:hypothetical protein
VIAHVELASVASVVKRDAVGQTDSLGQAW